MLPVCSHELQSRQWLQESLYCLSNLGMSIRFRGHWCNSLEIIHCFQCGLFSSWHLFASGLICFYQFHLTGCPIISDTIFRRNISFIKAYIETCVLPISSRYFRFLLVCITTKCFVAFKFLRRPTILLTFEKKSIYGHFGSKFRF